MPKTKKAHSDALRYTYDRYIQGDPEQIASYEQELANIEVAKRLYDLRTKAGLSQRELAKRVGTTASAICRLEDADYEGHSLSMLRRIAVALGKRVEIRFLPLTREAVSGTRQRVVSDKREKVESGRREERSSRKHENAAQRKT